MKPQNIVKTGHLKIRGTSHEEFEAVVDAYLERTQNYLDDIYRSGLGSRVYIENEIHPEAMSFVARIHPFKTDTGRSAFLDELKLTMKISVSGNAVVPRFRHGWIFENVSGDLSFGIIVWDQWGHPLSDVMRKVWPTTRMQCSLAEKAEQKEKIIDDLVSLFNHQLRQLILDFSDMGLVFKKINTTMILVRWAGHHGVAQVALRDLANVEENVLPEKARIHNLAHLEALGGGMLYKYGADPDRVSLLPAEQFDTIFPKVE